MSTDLKLTLKREAVVTGLKYWVQSATGQEPDVVRTPDKILVTWKPGQAKKMVAYFQDLVKDKPPAPDDLNVSLDTKGVLWPFVLKQYWPYIVGTVATLIMIGRFTK